MNLSPERPACPVCRATFRGSASCPRCGAALEALMSIAVRAWRLRQQAREALRNLDFATARQHAAAAQQLQSTPAGHSLQQVAAACELME